MNLKLFTVFPYIFSDFRICADIPYFISYIGYLCLISFYFYQSCQRFVNIIYLLFSKNKIFIPFNNFHISISLISSLYYFIFSLCFGFILFFFQFLDVETSIIDLTLFLISYGSFQCYNFLSQHCFSCMLHISICYFSFQFSSMYIP